MKFKPNTQQTLSISYARLPKVDTGAVDDCFQTKLSIKDEMTKYTFSHVHGAVGSFSGYSTTLVKAWGNCVYSTVSVVCCGES